MATLFLLGYNLKICYLVGGSNLWWEEGTKIRCVWGGGGSLLGEEFFQVGEMSKLLAGGEWYSPYIPQ